MMYSTSRTQTTTCLLGPQFSSRCLNMQDLCLSFPVYLACLNICFCATVGLSEYPVVFLSMSPGTTLHMCLPSVHQTLLHTIRSPRSFSSHTCILQVIKDWRRWEWPGTRLIPSIGLCAWILTMLGLSHSISWS